MNFSTITLATFIALTPVFISEARLGDSHLLKSHKLEHEYGEINENNIINNATIFGQDQNITNSEVDDDSSEDFFDQISNITESEIENGLSEDDWDENYFDDNTTWSGGVKVSNDDINTNQNNYLVEVATKLSNDDWDDIIFDREDDNSTTNKIISLEADIDINVTNDDYESNQIGPVKILNDAFNNSPHSVSSSLGELIHTDDAINASLTSRSWDQQPIEESLPVFSRSSENRESTKYVPSFTSSSLEKSSDSRSKTGSFGTYEKERDAFRYSSSSSYDGFNAAANRVENNVVQPISTTTHTQQIDSPSDDSSSSSSSRSGSESIDGVSIISSSSSSSSSSSD